MKTRPVDKMMLLALAVIGCVLFAVGAVRGQISDAAEDVGPDPRLLAAMDANDLEYEIDEDNDVKVLLAWDDNRSHVVWANTVTEDYEGIEVREVWGILAEYASTDDVPKEVLLDLMTANFQLKFGKYALFVDENSGTARVRFILTVSAELDGGTLAKVINFVGMVADEKEKEVEDPDNRDVF